MATMLTGKPVIEAMREDLLARVAALAARGVTPGLAIVRVGERPDDLSYERTAVKRAEGLGIAVRVEALPADATQAQLEAVIDAVNDDASIHGCLLFRPLPAQMDERAVCDRLAAAMCAASPSVREWHSVTVAWRASSINATGRPMTRLRPTTTTWRPATGMP